MIRKSELLPFRFHEVQHLEPQIKMRFADEWIFLNRNCLLMRLSLIEMLCSTSTITNHMPRTIESHTLLEFQITASIFQQMN